MINITTNAIQKLKEMSDSEGIGHCYVRVKVLGGGCSGFTHDLIFDNIITEMDETAEAEGVTIVIDNLSLAYLEDFTIDYLDGVMSSGFRFNSPNIKSTCGCGSSVSYNK